MSTILNVGGAQGTTGTQGSQGAQGTNLVGGVATQILYWTGATSIGSNAALASDSAGNLGSLTSTVNGIVPGAAGSATTMSKIVGGIADNVASGVLTFTIPNAAHAALIEVFLTGATGVGGAVGANEAVAMLGCSVLICRTPGLNATASISSPFVSTSANVSGGTTVTITPALAAVSGASTAVNTVTLQVTIHRSSGSSSNHTCLLKATINNANSNGITAS